MRPSPSRAPWRKPRARKQEIELITCPRQERKPTHEFSNPYEPGRTQAELKPKPPKLVPETATLAQRSAFNAAVLAELGAKLVGLMFVLDGIGGLISHAVTLFMDRKHLIDTGIAPYTDSVTMGGFVSSFFYLFAGVYLITNGKFVIDLILMTDSKPTEEDLQS